MFYDIVFGANYCFAIILLTKRELHLCLMTTVAQWENSRFKMVRPLVRASQEALCCFLVQDI